MKEFKSFMLKGNLILLKFPDEKNFLRVFFRDKKFYAFYLGNFKMFLTIPQTNLKVDCNSGK
jgi:hypothetical protein